MTSRRRLAHRRRRAPLVVVCLTVALVAAACGSSSSTPRSAVKSSAKAATTTSAVLPITIFSAWESTWSYNPYNSFFPGTVIDGFVDLPLAVQIPPTLTKYSPQLATSWRARGDTLTVQLRHGATWQNGTPVTSTDVYDTILLNGTNGGDWGDLSNVSAPNKHEVVFTIRKGVPLALAEQTILGTTPYPSSVYGKFITPSLKADEIAYFNKDATDPTAAAKMPQFKAIGKVFTKLSAFAPKSALGDGPFKLKAMNTLEAKMTKWKGFYDASKIHMAGLDYYSGTTAQIYPWMYDGTTDWSWSYFPSDIVTQFLSKPDHHIDLTDTQDEYNLEFNDHLYPLDMVKVRQALAYILPRKKMILAAYGGKDPDGVIQTHPDGITPSVEKVYLTQSQISKLNTYPVNTSKAASLLKASGFHKSGKQWIMPNGKTFKLTLALVSGEPDIEASYKVAAGALSDFGIPSQVTAVSGATLSENEAKGNFQADEFLVNSLDPLSELNSMLGTPNNFTALGVSAGDRGIGFGPTETVPGLGKVAVAPTLSQEAASVPPGPRMKKLTWDWARLVNQKVPFLQYGDKVWQMSYSTATFTGWPSRSSYLWNTIGYNFGGGWLLILESGKMRPTR